MEAAVAQKSAKSKRRSGRGTVRSKPGQPAAAKPDAEETLETPVQERSKRPVEKTTQPDVDAATRKTCDLDAGACIGDVPEKRSAADALARQQKRGKATATDSPADLSQMEDTGCYDPDDPHQLGRLGEAIAANYLRTRGYKVLRRNWRCAHGEADIVALDRDVVVLVEVKSRNGDGLAPEEAVGAAKADRYRKLCLQYLMEHDAVESLRMDVIGVTVKSPGVARVHHVMSAVCWDS